MPSQDSGCNRHPGRCLLRIMTPRKTRRRSMDEGREREREREMRERD